MNFLYSTSQSLSRVLNCSKWSNQVTQSGMLDYPLVLLPPSPPSPAASSGSHSSSTVALYCNEDMTEDCSSSHSSGNYSTDSPKFQLFAVGYSKYCRYRAVLKRLGAAAYRLMDQPLVQAMGGLSGQYCTQLVFTLKPFVI